MRRAHDEMLSVLKLRSKAQGETVSMKYEPRDVLRVLQDGLSDLRALEAKNQLTLAGLRRNGWLAYRPSLREGMLKSVADQAWAKNF